jgi:hypothetical protein
MTLFIFIFVFIRIQAFRSGLSGASIPMFLTIHGNRYIGFINGT